MISRNDVVMYAVLNVDINISLTFTQGHKHLDLFILGGSHFVLTVSHGKVGHSR